MMRFNLNRPTTLDDIQRYISSYPSPEEAQADTQQNSPAGYNYLVNQFQHLNQGFGASMADPFEVAKAERAQLAPPAAAPIATAPTASGVAPAVATELARMMAPPNYSQDAAREIAGDMMRRKALMENMGARLATKDWQIRPDSSQSLIEQRATQTGHADLYRQIMKEDPSALATSQSTDDPRMALLPTGSRQLKIAADDNLHPVVNTARFKELEARDPASARRFYYAVSGRNYDTDSKAKALLLGNQEQARTKLIESIRNPEIDPIDGKLYHTVEKMNPMTQQMETQRIPVDDLKLAAINKEGGFGRVFGIDLPRTGIPRPQGMDDEAYTAMQQLTRDNLKNVQRPTREQVAQAADLAHRQLNAKVNGGAAADPNAMPGILRSLLSVRRAALGGINNAVIDPINRLLQGGAGSTETSPVPMIPISSPQDEQREYETLPNWRDVLSQTNKYYSTY